MKNCFVPREYMTQCIIVGPTLYLRGALPGVTSAHSLLFFSSRLAMLRHSLQPMHTTSSFLRYMLLMEGKIPTLNDIYSKSLLKIIDR